MNYTYYIADVFAKKVFDGAQVAVFPAAEGLNRQQMILVARELNLTETVFLTKTEGVENHFQMKIFSPLGEIDYAGHPIIAAAYILALCNRLKLNDSFMIDHSLFWDDHHNQNTESQNLAYVYGYETTVKYLHPKGQLEFGYTWHQAIDQEDGQDFRRTIPTHSVNARSYYNLSQKLEFDIFFYYVDQTRKSSSVSRVDIRMGYQPVNNLEISLVGTNLFDPEHIEGQPDTTRANSEIRRDLLLKAVWTY